MAETPGRRGRGFHQGGRGRSGSRGSPYRGRGGRGGSMNNSFGGKDGGYSPSPGGFRGGRGGRGRGFSPRGPRGQGFRGGSGGRGGPRGRGRGGSGERGRGGGGRGGRYFDSPNKKVQAKGYESDDDEAENDPEPASHQTTNKGGQKMLKKSTEKAEFGSSGEEESEDTDDYLASDDNDIEMESENTTPGKMKPKNLKGKPKQKALPGEDSDDDEGEDDSEVSDSGEEEDDEEAPTLIPAKELKKFGKQKNVKVKDAEEEEESSEEDEDDESDEADDDDNPMQQVPSGKKKQNVKASKLAQMEDEEGESSDEEEDEDESEEEEENLTPGMKKQLQKPKPSKKDLDKTPDIHLALDDDEESMEEEDSDEQPASKQSKAGGKAQNEKKSKLTLPTELGDDSDAEEEDSDFEDDDDEDEDESEEEEESPKIVKGGKIVGLKSDKKPKSNEAQLIPVKDSKKSKDKQGGKDKNKGESQLSSQTGKRKQVEGHAEEERAPKRVKVGTAIDPDSGVLSEEQLRKKELDKLTLFVKHLPKKFTDTQILRFSPDILSVRRPSFSSRWAFLTFANEALAEKNFAKLKSVQLGEHRIFVDYVGDKAKNTSVAEKANEKFFADKINDCELWVGNLPKDVNLKDLRPFFPKSISVTCPKSKGSSKRQSLQTKFAFVQYANPVDAKADFQQTRTLAINGVPLQVRYSRIKEQTVDKSGKPHKPLANGSGPSPDSKKAKKGQLENKLDSKAKPAKGEKLGKTIELESPASGKKANKGAQGGKKSTSKKGEEEPSDDEDESIDDEELSDEDMSGLSDLEDDDDEEDENE